MKADKELIQYIKIRHGVMKDMMDSSAPHTPEAPRHIYSSGAEAALRALLDILDPNDH